MVLRREDRPGADTEINTYSSVRQPRWGGGANIRGCHSLPVPAIKRCYNTCRKRRGTHTRLGAEAVLNDAAVLGWFGDGLKGGR